MGLFDRIFWNKQSDVNDGIIQTCRLTYKEQQQIFESLIERTIEFSEKFYWEDRPKNLDVAKLAPNDINSRLILASSLLNYLKDYGTGYGFDCDNAATYRYINDAQRQILRAFDFDPKNAETHFLQGNLYREGARRVDSHIHGEFAFCSYLNAALKEYSTAFFYNRNEPKYSKAIQDTKETRDNWVQKLFNPESVKKRFDRYKDGIIIDHVWGILWQAEDDEIERSFEEAAHYCQNLKLNYEVGWRLPLTFELLDLSKAGFSNLKEIFPNLKRERYWTCDELLDNPYDKSDIAYTVDFKDEHGSAITYSKFYKYYVRAVKDLGHYHLSSKYGW